MSCFELTHARHDHMHCLAPGLFRAIRMANAAVTSWR